MWFADMCLNFVKIWDSQIDVIDPKVVALKYLKSGFVYDLCLVAPSILSN